jgi:hypothetical protein
VKPPRPALKDEASISSRCAGLDAYRSLPSRAGGEADYPPFTNHASLTATALAAALVATSASALTWVSA